jgi:hypothetical protein
VPRELPLTKAPLNRSFDDLEKVLQQASKRPLVGFTQGGSSRGGQPAIVAATDADDERSNRRRRL